MDMDNAGTEGIPEKEKSATLLSFFQHKPGANKSCNDKPKKNAITALKCCRTSDSYKSDSESDNYHRRAGKLQKSEGKSRSVKASLANREKMR